MATTTKASEQVESESASSKSAEGERSQDSANAASPKRRPRRLSSRLMMLARRTHLYAGLFLLPWVFLYGITGAMFNHQGLFPRIDFRPVPADVIRSEMDRFPTPESMAAEVVESIKSAKGDIALSLAESHQAEFTNDVMFEINVDGKKRVVHLDPIAKTAQLATHPPEDFKPEHRLSDVKNIRLESKPLDIARSAAKQAIDHAGLKSNADPRPFGWTKLNFLAMLNDEPVRITYVLKDGHVDVMTFDGQPDMPARGFFLRLHTTHGQPPHWNGRMIWSLFVDAMAIAMVTWGATGLLMWWQIKRTRLIGGIVMLASVLVAAAVYFAVFGFYARTML